MMLHKLPLTRTVRIAGRSLLRVDQGNTGGGGGGKWPPPPPHYPQQTSQHPDHEYPQQPPPQQPSQPYPPQQPSQPYPPQPAQGYYPPPTYPYYSYPPQYYQYQQHYPQYPPQQPPHYPPQHYPQHSQQYSQPPPHQQSPQYQPPQQPQQSQRYNNQQQYNPQQYNQQQYNQYNQQQYNQQQYNQQPPSQPSRQAQQPPQQPSQQPPQQPSQQPPQQQAHEQPPQQASQTPQQASQPPVQPAHAQQRPPAAHQQSRPQPPPLPVREEEQRRDQARRDKGFQKGTKVHELPGPPPASRAPTFQQTQKPAEKGGKHRMTEKEKLAAKTGPEEELSIPVTPPLVPETAGRPTMPLGQNFAVEEPVAIKQDAGAKSGSEKTAPTTPSEKQPEGLKQSLNVIALLNTLKLTPKPQQPEPQKPKQTAPTTGKFKSTPTQLPKAGTKGTDTSSVEQIIGALQTATLASKERRDAVAMKTARSLEANRKRREAYMKEREERKKVDRAKRVEDEAAEKYTAKVSVSLMDKKIEQLNAKKTIDNRFADMENTMALKFVDYIAEELSPKYNMWQQFQIPEELQIYAPLPLRASPTTIEDVSTRVRSWRDDAGVDFTIIRDPETIQKIERGQLDDLDEAGWNKIAAKASSSAGIKKFLRKQESTEGAATEEAKTEGEEGKDEITEQYEKAIDNAINAAENMAKKREEYYKLPEFSYTSTKVQPFAREQAYVDAVNAFASSGKGGEDRGQLETVDRPPDVLRNDQGQALSDVAIAIRTDNNIIDSLSTVLLNPVAYNKYEDLMAAEFHERYNDQLYMYQLWQILVDAAVFGPLMWANSYLRQLLPKVRKLKAERDGRLLKQHLANVKREKLAKEGKVPRKTNFPTTRSPVEHSRVHHSLTEPELFISIPNNLPENRAFVLNNVINATLKNPSYTMKQKRGIIANYRHGITHMGSIQQSKKPVLTQEEEDNRKRAEFIKEDKKMAKRER